ncbi:MAG: TonB dependent receptor [Bacteroidales bacterium]|nr:TonB dependent receptor [Bacteroidales bacterium]
MKKIFYVIAIAVVAAFGSPVSLNAARQSTVQVKGRVCDAKGEALGFATVALMKADSTIVTGTAALEDGTYSFTAPAGDYLVQASLIGYGTETIAATLVAPSTELPLITLTEDARMLEGAVLTSRQSLVEMKVDKIVMNVSQSAFAQGNTALDLVKKAPGVTVDKDGNIMLNGKQVSVWIDGRPSHLDGKSLEALLRSTDGSSIEKFELMANPSSKYDAEGQGGIINIKTKRNFMAGFNGTVGIDGGGMYFEEYDRTQFSGSAYANLNYRGRNTNTFLNLYTGHEDILFDFDTELEMDSAAGRLQQKTASLLNYGYTNMNIKLGNDWFIDDKNTFGMIVSVPGNWGGMHTVGGDGYASWSSQYLNGMQLSSSSSLTDNRSRDIQASGNVNYTHIFDETKASELTANLDYYRTNNRKDNLVNEFAYVTGQPDVVWRRRDVDNDASVNIYSAKVDYQTVFWKNAMLEAGGKYSLSMTDNEMLSTETGMPDSRNDFSYNEHVAALYVSAAKQLHPQVSMKLGLRGEFTHSAGDWKSAGEKTSRNYFNLFPTFYLGYNPSQKFMLSVNYTRRIRRPGYYALNPAIEFADAHSFTKGNPDLLPQFSHSVSATSVFLSYLSFTLGYDYTQNMINQTPTYEPNGDQYLVWSNFGNSQSAYANFAVSALPVTKWLMWTFNVTGMMMDNKAYDNSRNTSWTAQVYTDFSFLLPQDWKIQADFTYRSPISWGYFKMHPLYLSNLAVKKNLLDNKLVLSLSVNDLFRTMREDITMIPAQEGVLNSVMNQRFLMQKVKLGLQWNFGQAQRTKYRKVGSLEESSRLGGSGFGAGK